MTFRFGQVLSTVASVALLGLGWFFFAPTQLGGSDSYVQIYGTSMHPHFHAGDLVIVRATGGSFRVGDVVAYRNAQLGGQVVMHRIIRIAGDRYIFKGDNNDFVDSYHATRSELVGRMWIHAPAIGKYLVWLHGPHLFLVGGIVALLALLLGGGLGTRRRGRRGGNDAVTRQAAAPAGGGARSGSFGAVPLTAAVALLACAGLAALSFTRPVTTHAVTQGVYTQGGRFTYDAQAPAGARIYGATTVKTGQPLFLRLVRNAKFHFAYTMSSARTHAVGGTIALDARISGANGWTRTLHLAGPMSFTGDRSTITGDLSFRSLSSLLERVDALTNANGGTYTLTLLPRVHVHGIVGGNVVDDRFAPQLPLSVDANELQLQPAATGAGASASLHPTASGSGPTQVANRITFLKFKLPVSLARTVSLIGSVLAAILLVVGLILAVRARPAGEHDEIERHYGDLIVEVEGLPASPGVNVVRTSSMEGLARVADQAGRMIMHVELAGLHTYFVEEAGVRYTYEHGADAEAPLTLAGEVDSTTAVRLARGA